MMRDPANNQRSFHGKEWQGRTLLRRCDCMTVRAHCLPLSKIHSFHFCCDNQEKSSPEFDSQNGCKGREMTIPVRFRLFASRSCMIGWLANHLCNRVTLNRAWEIFTHLEMGLHLRNTPFYCFSSKIVHLYVSLQSHLHSTPSLIYFQRKRRK